jgi:hypothetical protein
LTGSGHQDLESLNVLPITPPKSDSLIDMIILLCGPILSQAFNGDDSLL